MTIKKICTIFAKLFKTKELDLENINRSVSVNNILLELDTIEMDDEQLNKWEDYFNSFSRSSFLKIIDITHFYNKNYYDFYFILEDSANNWTKKIILTSNIVDLVLKHKLLHYITIKYYIKK